MEKKKQNQTNYNLKFKDEAQLFKFLFLYKDLLVPYSECRIKEIGYNTLKSRWMRFGVRYPTVDRYKYFIKDGIVATVLMYPDDFRNICNQFRKERLCPAVSVWVFDREL